MVEFLCYQLWIYPENFSLSICFLSPPNNNLLILTRKVFGKLKVGAQILIPSISHFYNSSSEKLKMLLLDQADHSFLFCFDLCFFFFCLFGFFYNMALKLIPKASDCLFLSCSKEVSIYKIDNFQINFFPKNSVCLTLS